MSKMRITVIAAIVIVAIPLAGCADDAGSPADEGGMEQVAALDNEFDPSTLSIAAGDQVEWTNEGDNPHTVEIQGEGGDQKLHSEEIQPGDTTSYTFDEAGTYEIWCGYHGQPGQGMAMTVTVE